MPPAIGAIAPPNGVLALPDVLGASAAADLHREEGARQAVDLATRGERMVCTRTMVVRLALGLAVLFATIAARPAAAQDAVDAESTAIPSLDGASSPSDAAPVQPIDLRAQIAAGECASLGATIAELADVTRDGGYAGGATSAANPATSFTTVPLTLDALEASAASIFVSANGRLVACGAIGGVRAADNVLVITLQPVGDAGRSGIAFLSANATDPSQTDVSLFLNAG